MSRRALLFSPGLLGALVFCVEPSSAQQASRIIDRTLLCETGITGGVRQISLHSSSAVRPGPTWAGVEARTNIRPTWRLAGVRENSIELSPACRRSETRVRLTSRGLGDGVVSDLREDYDCWTPRWVVVRARAVFRSTVTLRTGRPWGFPLMFARGKVKEAYMVIQTQTGKPIAFGALNQSGKTRVFTSRSCFPD